MDSFDLFINSMIENEIKNNVDSESLKIINNFENKIINYFDINYFTKEGYTDYCKISNKLFLIHFIGDAQFVVLNRLFNNDNKYVTFKELYYKMINYYNYKKNVNIPIELLTKEDIDGIIEDFTILDELYKRGLFSKSKNIKALIDKVISGDLSAFKDYKCYVKNLKSKIELEDLGLTGYIEKIIPYYLSIEKSDDKIIDFIEDELSQKR